MHTNYIQLLFPAAFRTVRINLGQENGCSLGPPTTQTVLVVILVVLVRVVGLHSFAESKPDWFVLS